MKFKTSLEALILGALAEGELHGYAIAKIIERKSEGQLKLGENQLYPTLHRLERDGFVAGDWRPQENKPPRKVYLLTEAGMGELEKYRQGWASFANGVGSIIGAPAKGGSHG